MDTLLDTRDVSHKRPWTWKWIDQCERIVSVGTWDWPSAPTALEIDSTCKFSTNPTWTCFKHRSKRVDRDRSDWWRRGPGKCHMFWHRSASDDATQTTTGKKFSVCQMKVKIWTEQNKKTRWDNSESKQRNEGWCWWTGKVNGKDLATSIVRQNQWSPPHTSVSFIVFFLILSPTISNLNTQKRKDTTRRASGPVMGSLRKTSRSDLTIASFTFPDPRTVNSIFWYFFPLSFIHGVPFRLKTNWRDR